MVPIGHWGSSTRSGGGNSTLRATTRHNNSRSRRVRTYAALGALVGFGLTWGLILWKAQSSLILDHRPQSEFLLPPLQSRPMEDLVHPRENERAALQSNKEKSLSNIYYGWQPLIPEKMSCSWRECFKANHNCHSCRDALADFGTAPVPPENWIPDVTMLHRMLLDGTDSDGRPWPPPLDSELCDAIGAQGGKADGNKECE
jgi:hypothetical protein